ncbi:hypothetical protein SAY86_001514 [Trapa natans]|uniref:Uncharacterized protein n=1 Tax=Trapa natans TaxID=22666 RepID=A0AAN7RMG9_TRANT|nr:hypothetical protein SAY86_001514 [Trapa natans]
MSLNCLTCQTMERTNSDHSLPSNENRCHNLPFPRVDRNWSGQLLTPPYDEIRDKCGPLKTTTRKRLKGQRGSTGGLIFGGSDLGVGHHNVGPSLMQPKLVRSGGMRRDWSFEDLRHDIREGNSIEERKTN